jgi:hypothetical protein
MKNIPLFIVFIGLAGSALGQTTLQVLTKTIEKTVKWKPGYTLEINGEKAEVEVSPGNNSEIVVHAELTTKHPDMNTARMELENWKFVVSTVGKKIYVRAYIGLKNGQSTPVSNFKAKIVVRVPTECPVSLNNKLGKVRLENLRGPMALTGEFCNFELSNLGGDVWLDTKYGTVDGKGFSGKLAIQTNRADVTLSDLRADCSVQSAYGKISVEALSGTGNLAVQGDKSEVRLLLPNDSQHNVHLKSSYGALAAPQNFQNFSPASNILQANSKSIDGRPFVSIETTFGKITVE